MPHAEKIRPCGVLFTSGRLYYTPACGKIRGKIKYNLGKPVCIRPKRKDFSKQPVEWYTPAVGVDEYVDPSAALPPQL